MWWVTILHIALKFITCKVGSLLSTFQLHIYLPTSSNVLRGFLFFCSTLRLEYQPLFGKWARAPAPSGKARESDKNGAHSTLFLILSFFWQRSEKSTIQVSKPWPSLWYLRTPELIHTITSYTINHKKRLSL